MRLINGSSVVFRVEEIPIPTDKNQSFYEGCRYMQKRVLRILHTSKTIDAEVVCRCKDCERRNKSADLTDTVYCPWLKLQMRKDDFCSYGERGDG